MDPPPAVAAVTETLNVWWDDARVGTLRPGRYEEVNPIEFAYEDSWIADPASPAVSHYLPKDRQRFRSLFCRPFFEGLLPEGTQKEMIGEVLGVGEATALPLLAHMGAELAGALAVLREDEVPPDPAPDGPSAPLSDEELAELLSMMLEWPFLVGAGQGFRLSLSGSQPKMPVVLVDGRVALPAFGQPTTHILKPGSRASGDSTENEAFAMRLAARLGVAVAPVRVGSVDGRSYLLVERYDRVRDDDGRVRRLHQEDFRQAFGMVPLPKTAWNGGPGYAEGFDLVRLSCTFPAAAALQLVDAAILQVLLGNARAHARSYNLLWRRPGEIALAPLYGLVTTATLPNIPAEFLMKVARRSTLEELGQGDWERFAAECGLSPSFVRRRVRELCGRAEECADGVAAELTAPGLREEALAGLAALVRSRAQRLAGTAR
ncbi:MAG: HipA domain-containing protein [Gemmatimonadetes bacterium]|nr:HipA domain-containing protein [Gemmatimonadota bacterium]